MKALRLTILAILAALVVLVPTAAALGPNIVVNGSFEDPFVGPAQVLVSPPTPIPGWTVEQGTVDIVSDDFWQAAHGDNSIDLSGSPGMGTLSQNVATQPGRRYRLRFAMAGNPFTGGPCESEPAVKQMRVEFGNTVVATLSFDTTGHSFTDMGWTYHTFRVRALTPTTTLRFVSLTGEWCGPTLDDVSLRRTGDDDDDD